MKTRALCIVTKKNIRCEKCDILLEQRLYRNQKIAFSISPKSNSGFLCVKCIQLCKKKPTIYKTTEQLDQFLELMENC